MDRDCHIDGLRYIAFMRITTKCKIAVDALLEIAAHTEKGYAISLPISRLSLIPGAHFF
jgi:DNA-binding IscR family transcriptional regulator